MVGQTLAHYRITQKLGAGGMGEVYRATDSKLHRDVAIKVLPAAVAADPDRMARFQREAHVLASLTHGSIAAVYGLEDANGSKALVMELVDGEDLSERLRGGALPLDETLRIAAEVAGALEAAHEQGIIHRDLKPANIKVLPDGHIKLLDFGLAKALEGASASHLTAGESATLSLAATQAGIILGTAAYMSPEQATGAAVDRRADVWSFGVVVFEMLTGRRLFDGETTSHVLAGVIRADIDFTRLPAHTPRELRSLLERCLERDARRRLRDIREARLAVEHLLERKASEQSMLRTARLSAGRPVSGWRDRLVWAAGGLAVGLLALAAAILTRPSPAPTPVTRVAARLTDDALFTNVGAAFDVSPDGLWIAFTTGDSAAATDAGMLRLRRLSELDSTVLVSQRGQGSQNAPYNPFFSPDGSWVGYATPNELRKVPIGGGTPLTICKVALSRGASWGPDDTIVLAPTPESGLYRVPAAGGEPQALTTLDAQRKEITHRWPQVLPGGAAVLFTSHDQATGFESARIEAVTIATGARTVVQSGGSYGRYVPSGHVVYVHDDTLFAVRFDVKRLSVIGQPVPVVQNVTANAGMGAAQFAFSSTGLMAYMQGAAPVPEHPIVWVDRSGGTSTLLDEPGTYVNPRLSPDGGRLALTVFKNDNWDIWVHDLERRVSTRVTFDEAADTEQVWSPDGRDLAFVSERTQEAVIHRKPSDGSGVETIVSSSKGALFPQAWSPDGRVLAFTTDTADIGVLPLVDDGKPTPILSSRFVESDPAFSPDGRWMAYMSMESGQPEIYVRRYPSGTGRAQLSNGGGAYPRWARSGRELFYRTNTGLMVVPLELGDESVRTGPARELFRREFLGGINGITVGRYVFADYDVSPDGKRFVMFPKVAGQADANAGMVVLVSGWFEDLARAAATGR